MKNILPLPHKTSGAPYPFVGSPALAEVFNPPYFSTLNSQFSTL